MDVDMEDKQQRLMCSLKSETGDVLIENELPSNCTVEHLSLICNALLKHEEKMVEKIPYLFFINDTEIISTLGETLDTLHLNTESVIEIVYQQQAVFKIRPVTRCTNSIPGHAEAVISVNFSPDGKHLASGSGDTTVRFWDLSTQSPHFTCQGHKNWVLCISWAPDSSRLASACKNGKIIIWNPENGNQVGKIMIGHKQWITSLSWEPYHSNPKCRYIASSSKDCDVRIWDTVLGQTVRTISGHTKCVTVVKWGGSGLIYTASQDRTIKVWRASDGILCRTLTGHAHWVNTLALNIDYVLKIGPFDPIKNSTDLNRDSEERLQKFALERYKSVKTTYGVRLVSGSDDYTLFMWKPEEEKSPIARLTGHQNLVNDVKFSPDGRIFASASFDKSVRLWDGKTGKFICALRGHVQAVYSIAFSCDSRLMVSCSADSTLKLWNIGSKKLEIDLPGHADEVYAIDWSSDGAMVATGGKDKDLKLWQN